jgi:malonyl-CoA decarboxylase
VTERSNFLAELIGRFRRGRAADASHLCALAHALLSGRGEASGVALAQQLLADYATLQPSGRLEFLRRLADDFNADPVALDRAIAAYRSTPGALTAMELHLAAEPRRQELIRRLNLAPGGTLALVRMREEVMGLVRAVPALAAVDADFIHLLSSWFNRGFLVLRRIDWTTPAHLLEKIIRYEAVHAITGWHDLQRRLAPADRRCFAFFHPSLADEPLIFVEVALTADIPDAIGPLLTEERQPIDAKRASTAVFYSISNCQDGLKGVSLGNFLIKQVVEELQREIPSLKTFVTLSPVPGFGRWLAAQRTSGDDALVTPAERERLALLDRPDWTVDERALRSLKPALMGCAARYFLRAKGEGGKPLDPVARFHLGNGARLERIDWLGDPSPKGIAEACGLMVNYLYAPGEIERNHEAYANRADVIAARSVRRLLPRDAEAQPRPAPA